MKAPLSLSLSLTHTLGSQADIKFLATQACSSKTHNGHVQLLKLTKNVMRIYTHAIRKKNI